MMNILVNPPRRTWKQLCERPQFEFEFLESSVKDILAQVKKSGDKALKELTRQFDKAEVLQLEVTPGEIDKAVSFLGQELKDAIKSAAANIEKFHRSQRQDIPRVETMPGVFCWRKPVPIRSVGIYIPGGTAPLFSTVLMLAIPATLAGCNEIILCTPPNPDSEIHPAILFAARLTGVTRIFKVGGAQAIGAMAYGTETIPRVSKIFGPGNQFVTKAKQLVSLEGVAIDLPAGPSEVLIIADEQADPSFVAADLLSQAEHGEDSQVMLLVKEKSIIESVQNQLEIQLDTLPRKAIAQTVLQNSRIIVLNTDEDIAEFVNEYAPEHLVLNLKDASWFMDRIKNAGSVFIGNYSAEAIGDYASGTNHTLPTHGHAKAYSGVSLESFMKFITYQEVTRDGLKNIGPIVEKLAEAELLEGHRRAVKIRLDSVALR